MNDYPRKWIPSRLCARWGLAANVPRNHKPDLPNALRRQYGQKTKQFANRSRRHQASEKTENTGHNVFVEFMIHLFFLITNTKFKFTPHPGSLARPARGTELIFCSEPPETPIPPRNDPKPGGYTSSKYHQPFGRKRERPENARRIRLKAGIHSLVGNQSWQRIKPCHLAMPSVAKGAIHAKRRLVTCPDD